MRNARRWVRALPCATMCYMPSRAAAGPEPIRIASKVGVRELRQNLSIYLERVIAGERLEVTDRGRPVALLVPLQQGASVVERLVAEGRAIPASRRLEDMPPLKGRMPANLGPRLQRALQASRDDTV